MYINLNTELINVIASHDVFKGGILSLLPTTIVMMVLLYLVCKCIDMLLGLLKTWKNGNYKSSKMRNGIVTWVAELLAICFVILLDMFLGLKDLLSMFTLGLFIYKEGGSILENLCECGVAIPQQVASKLEVFNTSNNGEAKDNTNN